MSVVKLAPTDWQYAPTPDSNLPEISSKRGISHGWTACTRFPTEIHDELRTAVKIPDWNKGKAEHDVQWVSELSWSFRARIDVPADILKRQDQKAELVFQGIDTFATVLLNGAEILRADNHFRTWTIGIDISNLKAENELLVIIAPPQEVAAGVVAEHGPFLGGSCNLGDRARIGIRKAQYHARWDWGPELWCMGIDRPVHLHLFQSRIKAVNTCARVDAELRTSLAVEVDIENGGEVNVSVIAPDGKVLKDERITGGKAVWDLKAELWWPVNEGKQVLYEVKVELYQSGEVVDTHTRKIGFRRAELVQDPLKDQEGTSIFFRINNKPIFIGGSNWIPIDMVLSTGTPDRYRRWLKLMIDGGQNMIRVWGGGVFEPDCFYEMCDEMGLLVWQDFMFACGVYPVFPEFLASVEAEARENVTRLRHHASLVLLCGNNEDYQQVLQWDMDQAGDPLPARLIYEKLLPDICKELIDPAIPYWPGSPYGGKNWDTTDPTTGDIHQWNVWCGKEHPYQQWDQLCGRFVSEFGIPGMPDRRTVDYWLDGDSTQAHPQSKLMAQHCKAGSFERRFGILMNENFRMTGDLTEYHFRNQLMQSEGVGLAYRVWRRQWKGPNQEYCGGALVWQINDCWPVTSWALVDVFYRPKPAYFAIAHALKPISLGIARTVEKNRENDRPRQFYEFGAFQSKSASAEVWAVNSGAETTVTFTLKAIDLVTRWETTVVSHKVTLGDNRSTELWNGDVPQPPTDKVSDTSAPTGTVILHASIIDDKGQVVRFDDWPQPFKYLDLPDPEVVIERDGEFVVVRSGKPAKALWLDVEGENTDVVWGDNSFDLVPGEEYRVKATGLEGKTITYASLGWEKPRTMKA